MSNLTFQEQNLHGRFKFFGQKHLEFRRKCIGLLPQIYKEKIYEKKGFNSIFEYAASARRERGSVWLCHRWSFLKSTLD